MQPWIVVDWSETGCLMEVSTMFYICRYCVFTCWGRSYYYFADISHIAIMNGEISIFSMNFNTLPVTIKKYNFVLLKWWRQEKLIIYSTRNGSIWPETSHLLHPILLFFLEKVSFCFHYFVFLLHYHWISFLFC